MLLIYAGILTVPQNLVDGGDTVIDVVDDVCDLPFRRRLVEYLQFLAQGIGQVGYVPDTISDVFDSYVSHR
jgi:hypothetical protein